MIFAARVGAAAAPARKRSSKAARTFISNGSSS